MVYLENKLAFDTLDKKIGLIYSYITSLNLLINTQSIYIIKNFCENSLKPLDSYGKICNFLKEFIETHENDLIEIDNSNLSDFESMKFHFENLEHYQKSDVYNISFTDSQKNKLVPKTDDSTLNKKPCIETQFKNEITHLDLTLKENKDQLEEFKYMILEAIQTVRYTTIDELLEVFQEIKDVELLFNVLLDLAYNENEITIEEKIIPENNELQWVFITTNNPEKVLEKSIKLNAKNKTKKELSKSMPNILPKYDNEISKTEFINSMLENRTLETNSKGILSVAKT
jgi:hypothetical protein